jgi:hypothetical protein
MITDLSLTSHLRKIFFFHSKNNLPAAILQAVSIIHYQHPMSRHRLAALQASVIK